MTGLWMKARRIAGSVFRGTFMLHDSTHRVPAILSLMPSEQLRVSGQELRRHRQQVLLRVPITLTPSIIWRHLRSVSRPVSRVPLAATIALNSLLPMRSNSDAAHHSIASAAPKPREVEPYAELENWTML
jgi:hypothetical protein